MHRIRLLPVAWLLCACVSSDTSTTLLLSLPVNQSLTPACLERAAAAVPGVAVSRGLLPGGRETIVVDAEGATTGYGFLELGVDTAPGARPLVMVTYWWFGPPPELREVRAAADANRRILGAVRGRCSPGSPLTVQCSLYVDLEARARTCPAP